jgi:endoglucanase
VNYGNMLEAPHEGAWGIRFDDRFPPLVREAGFDSVRLPVRWSEGLGKSPPYALDPEFLARVQHVVDVNRKQGLKVVMNVHHYEEIFESPDQHRERFLALWKQLAEAFKSADEGLIFEILNEPHAKLDAEKWNSLLVDSLKEVRKLHPDRWIVIGPPQWNSVAGLAELRLPENDRRLIVTVHYYLPFDFTHQGAEWVSPVRPTGIKWTGNAAEQAAIASDMQTVADWAAKHHRPVYVGEFGAYERADMTSRAAWTAAVREHCEKRQFAWAYWELASGFGILDPQSMKWKPELVSSLIPTR